MIRLLFLCRYFNKFHGRRGGSLQYYDDSVDQNEFLNHIFNEKYFGEDVRETLKRWIYAFTGRWMLQGGKGLYRAQKCRRMVFDLVAEAKRRNFIIESGSNLIRLRMDDRGRRFIKPLNFIEVCAREYGYLGSVLTSLLSGISMTLLIVFWWKIITFFANL